MPRLQIIQLDFVYAMYYLFPPTFPEPLCPGYNNIFIFNETFYLDILSIVSFGALCKFFLYQYRCLQIVVTPRIVFLPYIVFIHPRV